MNHFNYNSNRFPERMPADVCQVIENNVQP